MNLLQKLRGSAPVPADPAPPRAEPNPIYGLTLEAKMARLQSLGKLHLSGYHQSDEILHKWWVSIEIPARGGTIEFKAREKDSPLEAIDALIEKVLAAGLPL